MYHTLISRKPKTHTPVEDFTKEVDCLTRIVDKMVQPNASTEYADYFIYKSLFDSFTSQLVSLNQTTSIESQIDPDPDISYNYSEEYKHIFVREKQKPILELLKNKNNV